MHNNDPIIDIINFNPREHLFEYLSQFNVDHEKMTLRAYGENLTKGIVIA